MKPNEPILTISIAAKLLGVHTRTLMLYEKTGLIMPHRTNTNRRLFKLSDLDSLQFIKYLTQEIGLNLAGVKLTLSSINICERKGINLQKELFPSFKTKNLI